ncbi:hypothetical protein B0H66DRAFT_58556 [Apodospora peruviana]|uniref:Uncharacterized protein n=1 Tax=Apodospora peruviana TaxID=516989 RepID=A0AAE0ISE6_9PEZI|nr:hypothetical protein B0H66DRAFT_58556 [Apodospora peruviana]
MVRFAQSYSVAMFVQMAAVLAGKVTPKHPRPFIRGTTQQTVIATFAPIFPLSPTRSPDIIPMTSHKDKERQHEIIATLQRMVHCCAVIYDCFFLAPTQGRQSGSMTALSMRLPELLCCFRRQGNNALSSPRVARPFELALTCRENRTPEFHMSGLMCRQLRCFCAAYPPNLTYWIQGPRNISRPPSQISMDASEDD